jgi:choline dehydrogenase
MARVHASLPKTKGGTSLMPGDFDFIVVGAGSAGCVVAARLSADPGVRVLLTEAGRAERTRAMTVPAAWPENIDSEADWGGQTMPQADAGPVAYPRGKALGGSGAINAMAHVRGHRVVYDAWAASGAPGWGSADLLPFFRRSEHSGGGDPVLRGMAGPVRVAPAAEPDRHPAAAAFAGALDQAGCSAAGDLSGAGQEGFSWADLAIADGERAGPAEAYLRPALGRPNLTVLTDCLVTRLNVERGRCTRVSYLHRGMVGQAHAGGEVIVCAGAVGTPQLLMLSGIGPARHLRAQGITALADVRAVGENLQDHPIAMACYATPESLPASLYNHGEMYAAVRSSRAGAYPDLQLFPILLPVAPAGHRAPAAGFALVAAVTAPDSQGSIRLASPDPGQPPLIDPGFLREPGDLARLAEGLSLARRVAISAAMAGLRAEEIWPGPDAGTTAGLRGYIRRTVASYYHPAGTCRMGTGEEAAVDTALRVRGVSGLRVADASVLPVIPNAPLHATVLAIAERAADLITSPSGG